jgi:Asp-tRNA(Asn)/Glu-tRNA(Gln) amidotransferase A subunit family amidase
VDKLVDLGASLHEIEVPEPDLTRVAHSVIIITEMVTAAQPWYPARRRSMGLDVRFNYALSGGLNATDYVRALRVRARIVAAWNELFETVDLVVSPTTACTAPIHAPDALGSGESDLAKLERIMRFSPPANLTGNPAVSIPVGHDGAGLPVGLQLIARPWEEALLLRAARLLDARLELRGPERALDTLPRGHPATAGP